jgi:peptide/nickel transport system ATP-binding protein
MTQRTLLDVRHLCVDYFGENGVVHAVSDVSLALRRGEILGLAGESGSGKSTLAYAITRLLRPPAEITGGEALFYGEPRTARVPSIANPANTPFDILGLRPAELRAIRWSEIAIVFQSAMNALNPTMTVGRQLLDVLATHRPEMPTQQRQERARELFDLVGIAPDRLKSFPHELSGGMRQRATIAIALTLSPELIIMDEPTTALDVVVQREILTELMRLREKLDLSIIFITHDLSLLLEIADTIAIMYAGRVIEATSARALHQAPLHPYSYGMLHSFPSLRGPRRLMTGIPGSPPDLRAVPPGCAFHPRCPLAYAPCSRILPPLQAIVQADESAPGERAVACHRYDPAQSEGRPLPTSDELEESYSQLAAHPETGGILA